MDYLPGSLTFDPAAGDRVEPDLASSAVWFDAFVTNVDRTARNTNLLLWHKTLYLIDHGAALYFHHDWPSLERMAVSSFPPIRDHVLLPWASQIEPADVRLRALLTEAVFTRVLEAVPDEWLVSEPGASTPSEKRAAYVHFLARRLDASATFVGEALRARAKFV